jgi:hypothetical protein
MPPFHFEFFIFKRYLMYAPKKLDARVLSFPFITSLCHKHHSRASLHHVNGIAYIEKQP